MFRISVRARDRDKMRLDRSVGIQFQPQPVLSSLLLRILSYAEDGHGGLSGVPHYFPHEVILSSQHL